jgi:hypothetical protein
MEQEDVVCLTPECFNKVVDYLMGRPFREVHNLMRELEGVNVAKIESDKGVTESE